MQVGNSKEFMDIITNISGKNKLYIWGRSVYGNLLGILFNKNQIKWDGYYDNFCDFQEEYLNGKCTFKGDKIDNSEGVFYVLSMINCNPVQTQLLEEGIDLNHIITFENVRILECIEDEVLENHVSTELIKTFCDKHKGEKCFIIGNGPSLNINDLHMIYQSGYRSFASNLIFKCYEKTKWRPDYYFFTDALGIRETFSDFKVLEYASQNCTYIFSRSNGDLAKWIQKIPNLILFKSVFSENENQFDFSSNCDEKVYTGYSVTYAMLQMAVYMGFKEIYLLGMDHNYSVKTAKNGNLIEDRSIRNHSEILGKDRVWGVVDLEKITNAYIAAKNYANTHKIRIYNATRGGKLDVFERIDFDELVGKREGM